MVGVILFVLGLLLAYSRERVLNGIRGVNKHPRFQLGDALSWTASANDPWQTALLSKEIGIWKYRLRVLLEEKSGAEQTASSGSGHYIFDVALDEAATLVVTKNQDRATVFEPGHAPIEALQREDGITELRHISYCAEAGHCLGLSKNCARASQTMIDQSRLRQLRAAESDGDLQGEASAP